MRIDSCDAIDSPSLGNTQGHVRDGEEGGQQGEPEAKERWLSGLNESLNLVAASAPLRQAGELPSGWQKGSSCSFVRSLAGIALTALCLG